MSSFALSLDKRDARRITARLEAVAKDDGDDFLQYLYGMAILHIDEKARGLRKPALPVPPDPNIAKAAKLVAQGYGAGSHRR